MSHNGQFQIFGREYYQTSFGEKYLLLAPLGVHVAAGVVRRGLTWIKKAKQSGQFHVTKPNLLVSTAFISMALVPIHFLVNREYPSIIEAPIFALSPSQINFEYVKFGLSRWPIRTWLLYGIMVPAVTLHASEGMIVLARKRLGVNLRRGSLNATIALTGAALALSGLLIMSREPINTYFGESLRYLAAYTKSPFYR